MSEQSPDDEAPAAQAAPEARERNRQEVDVEKLADRVYRLMVADARLERARGHSLGRQRGR